MSLHSLSCLLAALCCATTLLSGSAQAAEPAQKCRYRLLARLPLQYHGPGMNVTMEGKINDTPTVMLIDTGATDTFLTRLATDKLGLFRGPSRSYVKGVGGDTRLHEVNIRNFELGPIRSNQRGNILAIDQMGERPTFDAIVGADFLLEMDVEISLAEKQIRFFSPDNCENTFLGYWNKAAVEVPLLFNENHQRPIVEVGINNVKLKALIDSGATLSAISLKGAKRAGITLDSPGVKRSGSTTGIGAKRVDMHSATFTSFAIGDEQINNATLKILATDSDDFDVILGTDFMRAHRMLFAVSQKKLYLSYIGGQPFNEGNERSNDWVEQEAKDGNGYAQFLLGVNLLRATGAGAEEAGTAWMQKAVAGKNPPALRFMASLHATQGRHAEALALYDSLLAGDPHDLSAQLEAFVLRLKTGQSPQAKAALSKVMTSFRSLTWPSPIADYYLGNSNLDELLRIANQDSDVAQRRRCEVYGHARALQAALGQAEAASVLSDKAKQECAGDKD